MISKITLGNFKCFEHQALPLNKLTLLTGLNGMGKSSVIQSLLLLRQSFQQQLLTSAGLALNGELIKLGNSSDALFYEANSDEVEFGLTIDNAEYFGWKFAYEKDADVMRLISGPLQIDYKTISIFNDNFQYIQAERLGPRVYSDTSDFIVRQHRQIGSRGEYVAHFLAHFGTHPVSSKHLHHPNAKSDLLRDQIEAWLGEISPGTRLHTQLLPGTDLMSLRYSFVHSSNVTNEFRSTNVGFGLSYTLPILTAILSATPGSFLALENPEAHLHPKGQLSMGTLLANAAAAGIQILVESHSDHLLNGIRLAVKKKTIPASDARVHFFHRAKHSESGKSEVMSIQINNDGRMTSWPEDFFDEWDKALENLLS